MYHCHGFTFDKIPIINNNDKILQDVLINLNKLRMNFIKIIVLYRLKMIKKTRFIIMACEIITNHGWVL